MLQPNIISLSARLRLLHQWISTRLWSLAIWLADKDHWRGTTICDISPSASKTSLSFRRDLLNILSAIEQVEPAAADLISKHVLCVGNVFPLHGLHNYYYVKRLLLIDKRALDLACEHDSAAAKGAALARCLFEGAIWGQLYTTNFTLFADRAAAAREWDQHSGQIDIFEAHMAEELGTKAAQTA